MSSKNIAVLGIDPGKVTGVFLLRLQGETLSHVGYELPPQDVFTWVTDVLRETGASNIPLHIFVEKYIITSRTAKLSQQTDALEVIGRVKAANEYINAYPKAATFKAVPKAGIAKLARDEVLKKFGWY